MSVEPVAGAPQGFPCRAEGCRRAKRWALGVDALSAGSGLWSRVGPPAKALARLRTGDGGLWRTVTPVYREADYQFLGLVAVARLDCGKLRRQLT